MPQSCKFTLSMGSKPIYHAWSPPNFVIQFLAALAALYLTLVSEWVSDWVPLFSTHRVTFETWENNDNKDKDHNDNDNKDKDHNDNDNKGNKNKDNNNKDNNNEHNHDHDHDANRGPNCDVRAVSQFCNVLYIGIVAIAGALKIWSNSKFSYH